MSFVVFVVFVVVCLRDESSSFVFFGVGGVVGRKRSGGGL